MEQVREEKTMEHFMKSKWLKFILISIGCKTSIWIVKNKKTDERLGMIKWYAKWRQYCFILFPSKYEFIFAQSCLRDIADFIKEQMDKRKIRKVRAKSISKISRKEARKAVRKI